jgi:ADP-ribose pyrophosphatase
MTVIVKSVYRGRIINLGLERIRLPNGREVELEIVRHPGGAAVVALNTRDQVCLVHQYRHASGGWLWELPAGKIDDGENPIITAERELTEEAGVCADHWDSLGTMHSSPGVFDEVIHLYLARVLHPSVQRLGHDEMLEVHWIAFSEALEWAQSGKISDAKTLIGLFRAQSVGGTSGPSNLRSASVRATL